MPLSYVPTRSLHCGSRCAVSEQTGRIACVGDYIHSLPPACLPPSLYSTTPISLITTIHPNKRAINYYYFSPSYLKSVSFLTHASPWCSRQRRGGLAGWPRHIRALLGSSVVVHRVSRGGLTSTSTDIPSQDISSNKPPHVSLLLFFRRLSNA